MQLTINIPDFVALALNKDIQELKETIKINSALMLFKSGKLSLEQASSFANLSLYEFLKECKKNKIPTITYSKNELEDELKLMDSL